MSARTCVSYLHHFRHRRLWHKSSALTQQPERSKHTTNAGSTGISWNAKREGISMTRILLTTTALVAFAGAAAADISFGGSATFSYNSTAVAPADGFDEDITITASGSQALDNGFTASASLSLDYDSGVASVTAGDVSLSSDNASVTYDVANTAAGVALLSDNLGQMGTVKNIFGDDDVAAEVDNLTGITASATMGSATVSASIDTANDYQVAVSTDLGGTSLAVGFDGATGGEFGALASGSAGSIGYDAAFASDKSFGVNTSMTAGGADITLDFGSVAGATATWEAGASVPLGGATVSASLASTEAWTLGVSTDIDALSLGFEVGQTANGAADTWEITAGLTQGAISLDARFDYNEDVEVTASYDMGNGIMAYAGYMDTAGAASTVDVTYVGVEYDLGGGASVAVSTSDWGAGYLAATDFGQDYADGTTVSVSFSF